MSNKFTAGRTITIAAVLCIVCSVVVASIVVALKERQVKNADIDYKKNVLMAAGLLKQGEDVQKAFEQIETIMVDLENGEVVTEVDANKYDQVKAAGKPETAVKIPQDKDVAGLSTRSNLAKVYLTRESDGQIKDIILYHRGKGLWSTMHGFIALAADTTTIKGFAYYSQAETPGLGAEVDNPNWRNQWVGKKIYDDNWQVEFALAKGTVDPSHPAAEHRVDGLAGATITGNGVTSSMKYWFGDHAYGKFLERVRNGEI